MKVRPQDIITLRRFSLRTRLTVALLLAAVPVVASLGVAIYYLERSGRVMDRTATLLAPVAEKGSKKVLKDLHREAKTAAEEGLRNLLLASAAALALVMTVGFWLWRYATRPLRDLDELLRRLEAGDLRGKPVTEAEEVANIVGRLQEHLVGAHSLAQMRKERIAVLRDRLRGLFDSLDRLGAGALLLDEHGAVVDANSVAQQLCGTQLDTGRALTGLPLPEGLGDALLAPLRRGEARQDRVEATAGGGSTRVAVSAILGPVGEPRGVLAVLWPASHPVSSKTLE